MKTTVTPKPSPFNKVSFFNLVPETNIDFVGKRYFFYLASAALVVGTIALLIIRGGPPLGVDFQGGIAITMSLPAQATIEVVRHRLEGVGLGGDVQSLGEPGLYLAKFNKQEEEKDFDGRLDAALKNLAGEQSYEILSKDFVGAIVGEKLRYQALMAILLSFAGIIIYVAFRFRNFIWGVAGVLALVHDVIVALGFATLIGYEVDLVLVASFLTIAGYSINDTVVIFDRMRERLRIYPREPFYDTINRAINDTLSRTLITSGATIMSIIALAVAGGMHLRPFAVTLLIGAIAGSYSTFGLATGLAYDWAHLAGVRK